MHIESRSAKDVSMKLQFGQNRAFTASRSPAATAAKESPGFAATVRSTCTLKDGAGLALERQLGVSGFVGAAGGDTFDEATRRSTSAMPKEHVVARCPHDGCEAAAIFIKLTRRSAPAASGAGPAVPASWVGVGKGLVVAIDGRPIKLGMGTTCFEAVV